MKIDESIAKKVAGLVKLPMPEGIGAGGAGQMCVQYCVAYATGEAQFGENDQPTCVKNLVRRLGIVLNDSDWSSNGRRSHGLRRFAIAELGTNQWNGDQGAGVFS